MILKRPLHLNDSQALDLKHAKTDEQNGTSNQALEDEEVDEVDEVCSTVHQATDIC